jgi:trigger factor
MEDNPLQEELKVTVEEPSAVTRTITVEVPADEVDRSFGDTVREFRGKLALPGFRKGKVPKDMIRRMYWGDITSDVARALIPDAFERAIGQVAVEPVSEPDFQIVLLEEGKPFTFTAKFEVRPRFEVQDYVGLAVDGESVEVTDEEVARLLEEVRTSHAKVQKLEEARGVRDGDVVVITFASTVEGREVPGGAGQDYPLTIGSDSFPKGFEDNLIGAVAGEAREFTVALPEGFAEASMAGKEALFKVTVAEIRERILPALDDEFAKDVGDYAGLEDLKAKMRENLKRTKEIAARNRLRDKVVTRLVEATPMEVPPTMIHERREQLVAEAERYLVMRGMPWEEVKKSRDSIREDSTPTAEKKVKASLILAAIAAKEQLTVAEEELAAEVAKIAKANKMDAGEVRRRLVANGNIAGLTATLLEEKALDFVVDRAKTL